MFARFSFCAVLMLAGCTPVATYYKEGVTLAMRDRALTDCNVTALAKVPVDRETRITPIQYVPRKYCDSKGNCVVTYEMVGGDIVTYDANRPLRDRVTAQCMADKGYRFEQIPPCPAGVANVAPKGVTTTLPRLTPKSCSIRNPDGTWQIVTAG